MTIGTYVAATEKISVIKIESRVNILLPFYMNNVHMPNRHEIVAKFVVRQIFNEDKNLSQQIHEDKGKKTNAKD